MAKGVAIGLADLHYALLVTDPAPGGVATYETPVRIPGVISANVNPNSSNGTLFADNGPYETASSIGEISLELNVADLPMEVQAVLFGHSIVGGVMLRKSTDIPPWVAIGFRSLKSDGTWRYTWLDKGKFSLPEQSNQTKGDSVEFQTPTTSGSFVKRDCDDEWERHIDEDYVDYAPIMGSEWFNSPYGGALDLATPTVSVVPANSAVAVAVGANIVWTFNKAIALSTATLSNFGLVKDADGAAVAGSLSINAARTIVTFDPTAALTAATAYRAFVTAGVKSVAGVPIAGTSMTKFTTA
jgi:phi13 family phage major tail protein